MKALKSVVSILSLSLLFVACEEEQNEVSGPNAYNQEQSTFDLNVPNNFNYGTTEEVQLQLNLEQAPQTGSYLLKVYAQQPSAIARPLHQAFISANNPINSKVVLPAGLSQVYLVLQAPDGSSFLTILPKSATLNHTFYKAKYKVDPESNGSPDCVSGCDNTRTHSGNWTANEEDEVYCVTGSYNGSGGFSIKKEAIVRLCGSGTIPNIQINKGQLQIVSGANVTVTNLNLNSDSKNKLIVHQGATLTITNWFSPNADVENYGTMNVAALSMNNGCDLENYGTFSVTSNNYATFNGDVENHGSFSVSGNANINSGSDFKNYCQLDFQGNLQQNGDIKCYSYTSVALKWTINSGAELELKDGAMAVCEDLTLNGTIEGKGSTNLFKVSDRTDVNWGGQIKKNLEFCDLNGIENMPNSNSIRNGAVQACNVVIPTSACNSEGNGQPQVVDTDNDGVADELDAYPNDPAKAGDSYYPAENQYGTLAYEDLWPAYGDYDFNDLVVDYRYHQVLNATNDVVTFNMNVVTRAIGGGAKNGFALELDLAPANVASVSGTRYFENIISNAANGTESGQAKTNIIIYDNASELFENTTGFAFVNTVSSEAKLDYDTALISINFSQPQDPSNLGTAPYNPYIFVDQTRGREVHLPGQAPSSLANANLFGSGDDNTNPADANSTYKSNTNLPWALHLVNGFDYPEEETDISEAYNYFSVWAQSGGASYETWYDDLPGYIDGSDLYSGQ